MEKSGVDCEITGEPDKFGFFSSFNQEMAKLGHFPIHPQVAFCVVHTRRVVECDMKIAEVISAIHEIPGVTTEKSCCGIYGPHNITVIDEDGDFYDFIWQKSQEYDFFQVSLTDELELVDGEVAFYIEPSDEFSSIFEYEAASKSFEGELIYSPKIMALKQEWWDFLKKLILDYKAGLLES